MIYNPRRPYWQNRGKMEGEFTEIAKLGLKGNMSEENIEAIHELMLEDMNNDRRFFKHTQPYDAAFADGDEAEEGCSPLLDKFMEQLSVVQPEICEWGRTMWLEDIDTPEICEWLKSLKEAEVSMLTLLVADGMKQTEVAKVLEKHDSAISQKMKQFRKSLEKVLPEQLKKDYVK